MEDKKFYKQTWFIIIMLVFFAPVGIYLMWKYCNFGKNLKIILSVIFIVFFIVVMISGFGDDSSQTNVDKATPVKTSVIATPTITPTEEPTATPKPTLSPKQIKAKKKAKAKKKYKKWIKNQFSAWDGSCPDLVSLVKENMNDPKSFEYVETRYRDEGTGKGITVIMTFRGKNTFGGLVKNSVTAFLDYKKQTIKIISQD